MSTPYSQLPKIQVRNRQSHKGTYGKVLIIGGSLGIAGAPALSARAALRSGAGLVRLAIPDTIWQTCCTIEPCATCIPLPTSETGLIDSRALSTLLTVIHDNDSIAIGPGLGTGPEVKRLLENILQSCNQPLVIDADGLNNLSALPDITLPVQTILTPHPGEMKRLWKSRFREPLPDDRQAQSVELARKTQTIVVLKGDNTIVSNGEQLYVNQTGNPGMATGGSGDVLTGIIAALLADQENNHTPFQAAILATYIHGLAGDLAAQNLTQIAMNAGDIVDFLPYAWKYYFTNIS